MSKYRLHVMKGRLRVQERSDDTRKVSWRTRAFPKDEKEGLELIAHMEACDKEHC